MTNFLWLSAFWEVSGVGFLTLGLHFGMFLHPPVQLDAVGLRNYLPTLPSQELNYFSQFNFCD